MTSLLYEMMILGSAWKYILTSAYDAGLIIFHVGT
jgi:hypothetical protein